MRLLKSVAGAGLFLAMGWNVGQAQDPVVIPVAGRGPCCTSPAVPSAGGTCPSTPGQVGPDGVPQFPNPDGTMGAPGTSGAGEGSQFGTSAAAGARTPERMHGDQFATSIIPGIPGSIPPSSFGNSAIAPGKPSVIYPTIRGFKIAEDESPRPEDRVYFDFNYYDRVNQAALQHFSTDANRVNAYRETFGIEKTFFDGAMSIGFRLPINTLEVDAKPGFASEIQSTNTAVGDLTMIFKFVGWENKKTNDLISFGMAVTADTGSTNFGGSPIITGYNDTLLQPFIGYLFHYKNFFLLGFTELSIPTDSNDAVLIYNDVGIGYVWDLAKQDNDRILRAVVPMVEGHLNDPLTHQGLFNKPNDLAGTADVFSITTGITFVMEHNTTVAMALVTPLTGPRPFELEAQFQLNWSFGGLKR
jgi:hypothetical protein